MPTQALLLQLVRHLSGYLQLGAQAAVEYRGAWARRIALLLVAMATGVAGVAALWGAGLVALWNTPWRLTYVIVTALLLLGVAAWTLYRAVGRPPAGSAAGMLRSELRKDMELFQEWKSTL